jgi:hypothetical protein
MKSNVTLQCNIIIIAMHCRCFHKSNGSFPLNTLISITFMDSVMVTAGEQLTNTVENTETPNPE